ncbi:MAG TPA: hypothetical protein PK095_06450, partial [Myxococcota bacterium]|nr:hypothetical protein [Myxococcota bacterium]
RACLIPAILPALLIVACQAERTVPTASLEVDVAPLALPGIGKACYDLRVTNAAAGAGDVVWERGTPNTVDADAICSDRFGASGGISYVGPCDASGPGGERTNSVTLWVDSLYDTALTRIEPDGPN